MHSPDIEKIKEQKLRELQERFSSHQEEAQDKDQEFKNQAAQLENLIKKYLSRDALIRYGNIKAVSQEKAIQVLGVLSQLVQYKKPEEKITDDELKLILKRIHEQTKRETKIHF